jgi:hypothetical protein
MDPVVASAFISATATVLGVGGTAAVAIVGFRTSRSTVSRTLDATREGQVADRYGRAIDKLGSDTLDVRLGGIYELERVACVPQWDYQQTVIDVLAAFIRVHSHEQWQRPKSDPALASERITRPDVQAALNVISHRDPTRDRPEPGPSPIDLSDADLTRAYLREMNLNRAALPRANLTGANLTGAKLKKVKLTHADLSHARLPGADLTGADLTGVDLTDADLTDADLTGADLTGVDLTKAILSEAARREIRAT